MLLPTARTLLVLVMISLLNSSYISGPPVNPMLSLLSSLFTLLSSLLTFGSAYAIALFLFLARRGSISRFNFSLASIFLIVKDTTDLPT